MEKATSLLTMIGGVVAVLVLFVIIIIVIWLYHKRHLEEPPPPTRSRQGSQTSQGQPSPSRKTILRSSPGETSPNVGRESSEQASPHHKARTQAGDVSQPPLSLPPPPRAARIYTAAEDPSTTQQTRRQSAGGGSRAIYRGAMVTFTILSVVTLACAAVCVISPAAKIIVRIPRGFNIEPSYISVFFNKRYDGHVITERWTKMNSTTTNPNYKIRVFDLDDAGLSSNRICLAEELCNTAHTQGLAGCDIAVQRCVCSRGFRWDDKWCMDINECKENPNICPAGITCSNRLGYYQCNCPSGFFFKHGKCTRCSRPCPRGQFESTPCAGMKDRQCKDCSECPNGMYAVQPCGGNVDKHCIHSAHPVLIGEEDTFPTFIQGLRFNWSSNVFVENLHNTRDLETIFYATAASEQQYDFWWVRESNVKVNIGLEQINIFPKYVDVDHKSDNHYMMGYGKNLPSISNEWFKSIRAKHCRHPIPDFYTITLQIATDRTTLARERHCSLNDHQCLKKVTDFQHNSYIDRSLNTHCNPMKAYPEDLETKTNNVNCVSGAGEMLKRVFNITEKPVRPLRNLPRDCKVSINECNRCLGLSKCRKMTDPIQKTCCQNVCYSFQYCKDASSPRCKSGSYDCAIGDAYSFTLEPYFNLADANVPNKSFQCHIKLQKPTLLYKLWFYVSIPEINLDLPKVFQEVYPEDVQAVSHGTYRVEFIDLEHDTVIDLRDEFILVGEENRGDRYTTVNYTVYPLKEPEQYEDNGFDVTNLVDGKSYWTRVQFNEVFGYSTSSWIEGNCSKDLSKFRTAQPHYRNEPQRVQIITETVGSPYKYYMKNAQGKDPYLKFSTPANTSVLKWWYKENGPILLKDETLVVELNLEVEERLWNISLSGSLSDCPGYLAVTINDREEGDELFKYDSIISCPPHFDFSFKIPRFGPNKDKTFDVILDDAKSEYRVFLTHISFETLKPTSVGNAVVPVAGRPIEVPFLLLCIVAVAAVLVVCVSVFIYLDVTHRKVSHCRSPASYYDPPMGSAPPADHVDAFSPKPSTSCCGVIRHMDTSRMTTVVLYIAFKIVYSFAFTFSVFFTLLVLCISGDLEQLARVNSTQLRHHNESLVIKKRVEEHVLREMERQLEHSRSMQNACQYYLEDITATLALHVDNKTGVTAVDELLAYDVSITSVFRTKFIQTIDAYMSNLERYRDVYNKRFNDSLDYFLKKYVAYLDRALYSNPWLAFWRETFSHRKTHRHGDGTDLHSTVSGLPIEFGKFAGLQDAFDVELWPVQFWERYSQMPEIPEDSLRPLPSQCQNTSLLKLLADTESVSDTVHFQYPRTVEPDLITGNTVASTFSVQEFLENLNLGVLRLVFFSMDLLLLFYRFTNLYLAVRSLCLGFEEHIHLSADDFKRQELAEAPSHKHYSEQYIPLRETYSGEGQHGQAPAILQTSLSDDMTQVSDQESTAIASVVMSGARSSDNHMSAAGKYKPNGNVVHMPPASDNTTKQRLMDKEKQHANRTIYALSNGAHTLRVCVRVLIEGTVLPKFVIGTAVLLLFSVIISAAHSCLTVDVLLALAGFEPDLAGLRWHVGSANLYISSMAKQISTASLSWYRGHMISDLQQLYGMQEFFNKEQQRRTSNYILEGCAVKGLLFSNGTCDFHRHSPTVSIPMMPCNFIAIQPLLLSDQDIITLEEAVHDDYTPIVSASQGIVLYFVYAILFVCAVMLIIHITGILTMYCLRVRRIFPTKPVYIIPTELTRQSVVGFSASAGGPSSSREGAVLLGQYGAESAGPGQYDTSFETEEVDFEMDNSNVTGTDSSTPRHGTAARYDPSQHARTVQFKDMSLIGDDPYSKTLPLQTSSPRIVPKASATGTILQRSNPQLTDMGYSETKV